MNWIYSIAFKLTGVGQISAAEQAVEKLDSAVDKTGSTAMKTGSKFSVMGNKGKSGFSSIRNSALKLIATLGIVSTTLGSIQAAAADDASNIAIDFATSGDGAKNIQFINDLTNDLGLNLQASKDGFKTLAGSLRGTNLEGEATRQIFQGVATAGGAMRLSADQIQGAYTAIGQIASKGKVQAEELRGQLGERIPGAFGIAARAMGVTQKELDKMLSTGKITAEDFLPKFAQELQNTFGANAQKVADGPAAAMERYKNSVFQLQVAFGTQLLPVVTQLLENYIIPTISFIGQHIELFTKVGGVILGVVAAVNVLSFAMKAYTAVQWLLNSAILANPITWWITGIVAAVAAVVYLWNTMAGFRGFITGMWEVIKELGKIFFEYLVEPFMNFGKVVAGIFTFDTSLIAEGITGVASMLEGKQKGIGERLGSAFVGGYMDGANAIAQKEQQKPATINASTKQFNNQPGNNNQNGTNTTAGATAPTAGLSGVTGRSTSKNVNINLQSLINELQIVSDTVESGVDEVADLVARKFLQIINTANQVQ